MTDIGRNAALALLLASCGANVDLGEARRNVPEGSGSTAGSGGAESQGGVGNSGETTAGGASSPGAGGRGNTGGVPNAGGRSNAGGDSRPPGGSGGATASENGGTAGAAAGSLGYGGSALTGAVPQGFGTMTDCNPISTKPYDLNACGYVKGLEFTPDGEHLIVALDAPAPNVHLFRLSDGALVRALDGGDQGALCTALSPDGRYLGVCARISTPGSPSAHIHDLNTQEAPRAIGSRSPIWEMSFSGDGTLLATSGENSDVWTVANGTNLVVLGPSGFFDVEFSPSEPRALLGSGDGRAVVLDLTKVEQRFVVAEGEIDAASFSPDGRFIVSVTWTDKVQLRDAGDARTLHEAANPLVGSPHDEIRWLTPALFVVRDWGSGVAFWKIEGETLVPRGTVSAPFDQALAASPDGETIAISVANGDDPHGFTFIKAP